MAMRLLLIWVFGRTPPYIRPRLHRDLLRQPRGLEGVVLSYEDPHLADPRGIDGEDEAEIHLDLRSALSASPASSRRDDDSVAGRSGDPQDLDAIVLLLLW